MRAIIVIICMLVLSVNYADADDWTTYNQIGSPIWFVPDAAGNSNLVVNRTQDGIEIINLADSELIATINSDIIADYRSLKICYNSNHDILGLINNSGQIVIYDYKTSQIISRTQFIDTSGYSEKHVVFNKTADSFIELSQKSMILSLRRVSDGKLIDSHKIEFADNSDVCLSANGHYTSSLSDSSLFIWDNFEKKLLKEIQVPKAYKATYWALSYSKLSADGKKFVYRDETDTIRIIDIAKSEIIFSKMGNFKHPEWSLPFESANFALSKDFDQIGIGNVVYDVKSGDSLRTLALTDLLMDINSETNSYSFLHGGSSYRGTRSPGSSGIISTMKTVDNNSRFLGNIPQFAWCKMIGYSYDGKLMSVSTNTYYDKSYEDTYFVIDTETKRKVGRCNFIPVFSPDDKNILRLVDGKIIVCDLFAEPTGEIIQPENRTIDSFVVVDERILLLYQNNNCVFYNYTDSQVIRKVESIELKLIEKGKKYILKTHNNVEKYDTYTGNMLEEYELATLDIPEEYVLLCQSPDYKLAVYVELSTQTIIYDQIMAEVKYSYEYIYPKYGVYGSKFLFASNNKVLIQTASEKAVEYYPRDYVSFFEVASGKTLSYFETKSHQFKISGNYEFIGGFLQDQPYSTPVISHKKLNKNLLSILSIEDNGNINESDELLIFPNPAQDNITIELPESFNGFDLSVTISDILGRQIKNINDMMTSENSLIVDISGLNTGIYMLSAEAGGKIVRSRFVVAR
ncbi:MAG: T9SS type A sorting domain-containing protein [Candidatus Kapabacteria bacterium]|jgi:hypothetical protein|nr:T9SS type A sorting domain-containing protein [Candidatus Kapabacteria bacterium]